MVFLPDAGSVVVRSSQGCFFCCCRSWLNKCHMLSFVDQIFWKLLICYQVLSYFIFLYNFCPCFVHVLLILCTICCSLFVNCLFSFCQLSVHFLSTVCSLFVIYLFTFCQLFVYFLLTCCSLFVNCLFTLCQLFCSFFVSCLFTFC